MKTKVPNIKMKSKSCYYVKKQPPTIDKVRKLIYY